MCGEEERKRQGAKSERIKMEKIVKE